MKSNYGMFYGLVCAAMLCEPTPNLCGEDSQSPDPQVTSGQVKGHVRYVADAAQPWRFGRYYIQDAAAGWLSETVIALQGQSPASDASFPNPGLTHHMDQQSFQFVPEILAIRRGDRIRFTNSDDSLHNVMLARGADKFNVNVFKGDEHLQTFQESTGIARPHVLGCVYHGSMRAWVFVFEAPWFAVTGKDGAFSIPSVPAGTYTLTVYHPAGRLRWTRELVVASGLTTEQNIELSPKDLIPLK